MISNKERNENKSKGPWGLKSFNFTYRKLGEELHRHRFITANNEESATEQFKTMMDKLEVLVDILEIEEMEISFR